MKNMRRIFMSLTLLLPLTGFFSSASAQTKLEATIFSYDGKDFVRTKTTLMQGGQSAVNTKLDPSGAAYKAFVEQPSYTGPATLFGQDYNANYAPLTSENGQLTGAMLWPHRNSPSPALSTSAEFCARTVGVGMRRPQFCVELSRLEIETKYPD